MSAKSFWNDDRDRELLRLHAEGLSCRKIGSHFGVSHVSVSIRMKVLGIEPHAGRPQPVNRGARDRSAESLEAPKASRAPSSDDHVRSYKRSRRGFEVPAHLEGRYFELLKSGLPIAEACRRLGITKNHRAKGE